MLVTFSPLWQTPNQSSFKRGGCVWLPIWRYSHCGDGHVCPLVTLYQQSESRDTEMLLLCLLSPFPLFILTRTPTQGCCCHGRLSPLSNLSGNTQTCPEGCFFGDSKSSWQWLYSLPWNVQSNDLASCWRRNCLALVALLRAKPKGRCDSCHLSGWWLIHDSCDGYSWLSTRLHLELTKTQK